MPTGHVLALALHPQLLRDLLEGLLSHDLEANPTYDEAGVVGARARPRGRSLLHLRKDNRVAVMVSNEALTALQWFTVETGFIDGVFGSSIGYNDVLRWVYDALFELNVEVDFVSADTADLGRYAMVVAPALYSAPESTLTRLREHVEAGGHLVTTFRTAVADEHVTVWHDRAPHGLTGRSGSPTTSSPGRTASGSRCTATSRPRGRAVQGLEDAPQRCWSCCFEGAECPPRTTTPPGGYAAVTRQRSGVGYGDDLGTMTSPPRPRRPRPRRARRRPLGVAPGPRRARQRPSRDQLRGGGTHLPAQLLRPSPVTLHSPVTGRSVLGDVEVAVGEGR